jgi:antitoxin HigA-1
MIEPRTETVLPAMHPGELLREEIPPALGRPRAGITHLLGVSRQALQCVLTERASVTPEMALRLGKLCGNGPELWLALQPRYDLARFPADAIDGVAGATFGKAKRLKPVGGPCRDRPAARHGRAVSRLSPSRSLACPHSAPKIACADILEIPILLISCGRCSAIY